MIQKQKDEVSQHTDGTEAENTEGERERRGHRGVEEGSLFQTVHKTTVLQMLD